MTTRWKPQSSFLLGCALLTMCGPVALIALGIELFWQGAPFRSDAVPVLAVSGSAALVGLWLLIGAWRRPPSDWRGDPVIGVPFANATRPAVAASCAVFASASPAHLTIDLYSDPDATAPQPVLLAIHGGGFISGDRDEWRDHASSAINQGFALAAIEYRLHPDALWPSPLDEAQAAVRWIQANQRSQNLDADRIIALGYSAGGYIALRLACAMPQDLRGVVAIAAPVHPGSPESVRRATWLRYLDDYFAAEPGDAASLLNHLHPAVPPTLLITGEHDDDVRPLELEPLITALRGHGVACVHHTIPAVGHDLIDSARAPVWHAISEWLRSEGLTT